MSLSDLFSYPFQKGFVRNVPDNSARLVIEAPYTGLFTPDEFTVIVQSFKPTYDDWKEKGFNVVPTIGMAPDGADYVFIATGKSKEKSLYDIACGFDRLKKGGIAILIGANDENGKRLPKWAQEFGLEAVSYSKNKSRIMVIENARPDPDAIERHSQQGKIRTFPLNGVETVTKPGIFGWNKIDRGSAMLADILPDSLTGVGADFGCGYGYLTREILNKGAKPQKIVLLDADCHALEAAKENLAQYEGCTSFEFKWQDLSQPVSMAEKFDWIVMNPPFHSGRKQDNDLGLMFIENALKNLNKKGQLYIVANSFLPYENTISNHFSAFSKLVEAEGYKIFCAQK
jgi:16S rRNA (guanine1207-N2)-methyltransferase